MLKKILVPLDGSDHAYKAVDFAVNLAQPDHTTVHLLHVVRPEPVSKGVKAFVESENIKESPKTVNLQLKGDKVLSPAETALQNAGIQDIETTVLEGDPAQTILDFAKDGHFDAIVIGNRGLGNVKGFLLGSVSGKVCHQTDRTCITVK
jgi:nucleotide-binding universal stress UspA family protein